MKRRPHPPLRPDLTWNIYAEEQSRKDADFTDVTLHHTDLLVHSDMFEDKQDYATSLRLKKCAAVQKHRDKADKITHLYAVSLWGSAMLEVIAWSELWWALVLETGMARARMRVHQGQWLERIDTVNIACDGGRECVHKILLGEFPNYPQTSETD